MDTLQEKHKEGQVPFQFRQDRKEKQHSGWEQISAGHSMDTFFRSSSAEKHSCDKTKGSPSLLGLNSSLLIQINIKNPQDFLAPS
ncbi:unnamed protein product [Bubo scandiacus]